MKILPIVSVLMWAATAQATVYDYHGEYSSEVGLAIHFYNATGIDEIGFRRGSIDVTAENIDPLAPNGDFYNIAVHGTFSDPTVVFEERQIVNTVQIADITIHMIGRTNWLGDEFFDPASGDFRLAIQDGNATFKYTGEDYAVVHAVLPGVSTFAGVDAQGRPFVFGYASLFKEAVSTPQFFMATDSSGKQRYGQTAATTYWSGYQDQEGYFPAPALTYLGARNDQPADVPEPASLALLAAAGILGARRRYSTR